MSARRRSMLGGGWTAPKALRALAWLPASQSSWSDDGAEPTDRPIDELPQLWNVLRGEPSLGGPRPLILADARAVPRVLERRGGY